MISGFVVSGMLALAAAGATADKPERDPFRLINEASFTASCVLLIINDSNDPVKLRPGEIYSRRIPLKREVRLVCVNGKTRDTVLSPGQTYRLIEVDGRLEIAR
jgi:hypothetical protein